MGKGSVVPAFLQRIEILNPAYSVSSDSLRPKPFPLIPCDCNQLIQWIYSDGLFDEPREER